MLLCFRSAATSGRGGAEAAIAVDVSFQPGSLAGLQLRVRCGGGCLCSLGVRLGQSAACLALSRCACATWRVRFVVGSAEALCPVFPAPPIIAIVRTFSRGLGGALRRAAEVHYPAVHFPDCPCFGSRLGSARGCWCCFCSGGGQVSQICGDLTNLTTSKESASVSNALQGSSGLC